MKLAGNIENLAEQLGVRTRIVKSWLDGAAPIPETQFLKAVDLIQVEELKAALPTKKKDNPEPRNDA